MREIFISYRRDDSRSATGRLADRLRATFGDDRVFRDLDSIAPGTDFEAALRREIGAATVLLAVVGQHWLSITDAAGRRRLDDPSDQVRREIESAMAADVTVIPVLVEGARMPAPTDVPPSLAGFTRMQAMAVDDARWAHDCDALINVLRGRYGIVPEGSTGVRKLPIAGLPIDLLELVVSPRRLMGRLAGGGVAGLIRALRLWLVTLLPGPVMLGAILDDNMASWALHGLLSGIFVTAVLSAAIAAGWRMAGVRTGWQQMTAGCACLTGGAWLLWWMGLLPVAVGTLMSDPQLLDHVRALARQSPIPFEQLAPRTEEITGPVLVGMTLTLMLWAAGAVWLVRAWNGLRLAWFASPLRAAGAAAAVIGIVWATIALLHSVANSS